MSNPYLSRLKALQLIVKSAKVDGLLLVAGIDGNFDRETAQALAFLLEGKSGHQLLETSMVEQTYEDLIFLVTPSSFKCYSQSRARDQIVKLLAGGLEGCQIFKPTEEEEADIDVLEEYKVGSFVQMVKGLGVIGLPCKGPLDIESWPLIQSYGIEGIGKSGFFTMNFKAISLFDEIHALYPEIDGQGFVSLLQNSLPMFLKHSNEVFSLVDRESLHDLTKMEESEVIEPFMDYFSCREIRKSAGEGEEKTASSIFRPRILAGQHTNDFELGEDQSLPFAASNSNELAGHFIVELADPKTPLACTRTCFLSSAALREGGLYPSDEDLYAVDNFQEMKAQWCPMKQDILYLYHCYISLIDAGHAAMEFFSINPRSTKHSDVEEIAKETFSHGLISRGLRPLPLTLHMEEMDLAGTAFPAQAGSNRLKRLKVSCSGLQSQTEGAELRLLGSVAYGETFIDCPRSTKGFEILSSGIPLVQSWPVLQVENIIQKYMSKLLRKISDESLVSSDSSRNEMTSTLGELVVDGAEEVTILTSNKYMHSIRGEMYIFEKGFVFYSPKVLPIVVEFEKDLESFTRYVPDSNNVMSTAVLLFELRNTSLTGFSGAEDDHELVGLALKTLEPSACRYFNHKVWPSWMQILSSLKSGGMKVVNESIYPQELWELHEYSSSERSKGYPLVLSDEKCMDTASHFNGESISKPKTNIAIQDKDSVPLVLIVGIPGSGHESLTSLLLESVTDNTEWRAVKKPLAGTIDSTEDILSKCLEETMSSLKMDLDCTNEVKKAGLLLPLVGYKSLRSNLKSLLNTKQLRSGSLYLKRIVGCLHTENLVADGRSMYYGGIFEQLLEEYVADVVIFGDSKGSACKDIKDILKSRLPNAKLIHAHNVAGSSLLSQPKTDVGQLSFSRIQDQPAEAMEQQTVYVTSTCSILEKEDELKSILQQEIDKSVESSRARPSLVDVAAASTSLVWLKVVYICPVSKSKKELSVAGREVQIAKSDSAQICLPSQKQQVQWIFVGENLTERYLTNLIKKCVQSPQQILKLREPADLRATEKQKIQKEHIFDPLPEGYRFTGSDYVDMDGNISKYHPHFNQYANHYLEKENQDVLKKNAAIQSYNSDLVDLQVKEIIRL